MRTPAAAPMSGNKADPFDKSVYKTKKAQKEAWMMAHPELTGDVQKAAYNLEVAKRRAQGVTTTSNRKRSPFDIDRARNYGEKGKLFREREAAAGRTYSPEQQRNLYRDYIADYKVRNPKVEKVKVPRVPKSPKAKKSTFNAATATAWGKFLHAYNSKHPMKMTGPKGNKTHSQTDLTARKSAWANSPEKKTGDADYANFKALYLQKHAGRTGMQARAAYSAKRQGKEWDF